MKFTPPEEIEAVLSAFAPLFSRPTWARVQGLVCGALLTSRSTLTAALRVLGRGKDKDFGAFHRVLNRAQWSAFEAARILLLLLVNTFAPEGVPLLFAIDDTIERRWGKEITPRSIHRDPLRSSRTSVQKTSGLRWISVHLIVPIAWAKRKWALPVLSALAPSKRYEPYAKKGRQHKPLPHRARALIGAVWRWLGGVKRPILFVADKTYAAMDLLAWCVEVSARDPLRRLGLITRLRLDARLFDPPPPRVPGKKGRPRLVGARQKSLRERLADPKTRWRKVIVHWYGPAGYVRRAVEITRGKALWYHSGVKPVPIHWVLIRGRKGDLEPQALVCTDLHLTATQIIGAFVGRWQEETTFEEVNEHLGLPGQRQWSDKAIERSTPIRLALFSLVALIAAQLTRKGEPIPVRRAAWYPKSVPTFSDTLAAVRGLIWGQMDFCMSLSDPDMEENQADLFAHMAEMLCHGP